MAARPICRLAALAAGFCLLLTVGVVGLWGLGPFTEAATAEGAAPTSEQLRARLEAAQQRLERRTAVAEDLLAGRLALLDAAAQMRALSRANPDFRWESFRWTFPGRNDDERHCRQAIAALHAFPTDDPARLLRTVQRLEAELARHLARGPIRLSGGSRKVTPVPPVLPTDVTSVH